MQTIDPMFKEVVTELEKIENESGIKFDKHRKRIARYLINHFVKEHLPPPADAPKFQIPEGMVE